MFRVYAEDFPNQCVSLSAPGLPMLERGKVVDPAGHMRARQEIIERAVGVLGRRLAIQWSDLHAGNARVEAPDQTRLMIDYSGRIITGLQMRTSAEGSSGVMGAEGNPSLALRKSIDKGMQPNKAGKHVDYLEIYEPDVLASETQPVLRYGASLFGEDDSGPTKAVPTLGAAYPLTADIDRRWLAGPGANSRAAAIPDPQSRAPRRNRHSRRRLLPVRPKVVHRRPSLNCGNWGYRPRAARR